MDTGAENSNGNENDSSEDEDNLPVEIIVNPNRLADTITSSTSNIILKPFFDVCAVPIIFKMLKMICKNRRKRTGRC